MSASEMLERGRSLQAGCIWLRAAPSGMHTGQEAYLKIVPGNIHITHKEPCPSSQCWSCTAEAQLAMTLTLVDHNVVCAISGSNMIADRSCFCRDSELQVLVQSPDNEQQVQRVRSLFFRQLQACAAILPLRLSLPRRLPLLDQRS